VPAPRVVFYLQAPTLLNVYAQSARWRLEVLVLASTSAQLAESKLLSAPRFRGNKDSVEHVFVCEPAHYAAAMREFRGAKLTWVVHNARTELVPLNVRPEACLALSKSVEAAHAKRFGSEASHCIVPFYEPQPRWKHVPNKPWAMRNRPHTRHPDELEQLARVANVMDVPVYGQDQPPGFLSGAAKEALFRESSCYVSCLPKWAGFGLAEHECFSAGVPVVGPYWGDLEDEMPDRYVTLGGDVERQVGAVRDLTDGDTAIRPEHLSELGFDMLRKHRSRQRMDSGIEQFLDTR
jgi:hypothetical protein